MTTLSIDIGGTKIRAGVVDGASVRDVRSIKTARRPGEESIMPAIIRLAKQYQGIDEVAVASAGVIVDGVVQSATDTIGAWAGTDIAGSLQSALNLPVSVLGDVHAHGLGEAAYGAARGYDTSLTVAVGTGIGGAYVEKLVVATGAHGVAGHIGHITHGYAEGLVCSCGRTGHIEAIASGRGISRAYERATGESIRGQELNRRAEAGDARAVEALHSSGFALGEVLGSLANSLDPALIILSGSVSRSTTFWWPKLREGFVASAMTPVSEIPLVPGELGDEAPLIGAAVYAKVTHA